MIQNIINYLLSNWIAILALAFSIPSCVFGIINFIKSIPHLKITTDNDVNYLVGFMYYAERRIAIADILIENTSRTDITVTSISLIDDSEEVYEASIPDSFEPRHPNGITFGFKDDATKCLRLDIISDNILHELRIPSNGSVRGYAVFECLPHVGKPIFGKISVKIPTKSFTSDILFIPLPSKYTTNTKQLSD